MIQIENFEVSGFKPAIRGMRNPYNSWDRSDSGMGCIGVKPDDLCVECEMDPSWCGCAPNYVVGSGDLKLAQNLAAAGTDHSKYRRMIVVHADILAPLYWWKEFDTYKVGTVANSCSTMHTIADKQFTRSDFSCEHLYDDELGLLDHIIDALNGARDLYKDGKRKSDWWQMIQLLPSSYNQKRTVLLNYEVLAKIYFARKNHKLDEWREFCSWIEKKLPYSKELICGGETDE